jgi:phytoene desaturase
MPKKVAIIGGGFAGLSAACELASAGVEVSLFEKNGSLGGRCRSFAEEGFTFDMGPSWYWMPEVFEQFFARFHTSPSDWYRLVRLDPSYAVIFGEKDVWNIPANLDELKELLEKWEPGAGDRLHDFLTEAEIKYKIGVGEFVWKPSTSVMEFFDLRVLTQGLKLQLFGNMKDHVRKYFKHPNIIKLLEFPVLFLGAKPADTPALYSLMNYADIQLGTWYPMGGMVKIPEAMAQLAQQLGAHLHCNNNVSEVLCEKGKATALRMDDEIITFDAIIGAGDYQHIDATLLPKGYQNYNASYWESRTMAPSALIFYLGVNKKISGLMHHNLYFDKDFEVHSEEIYDHKSWPSAPLFYACVPSVTDSSVAPADCENIFILIPTAPGLDDRPDLHATYLKDCIERMERQTGTSIGPFIVYQRSYAHRDFISDYNSFKGNAYGLANTLKQTAFMKPTLKNKKLSNFYYAGQLTVPGPGVPPSIISGLLAADLCLKDLGVRSKKQKPRPNQVHELV